jgi:Zn-dependent oligopeptidase
MKPVKVSEKTVPRQPKVESEALIRFDYKTGELNALCQQTLSDFRRQMEEWRTNYQSKKTDVETLLKFEETMANLGDAISPLNFMGNVSTSEKTREESSKCEEAAGVVTNEVFTNRENYELIKNVNAQTPDQIRLLQETKFTFEMNGMALPDADLKKFKEKLDRLSQLSVQFSQNLNNDVSTVSFKEAELQGAKSDFLGRLKKDAHGNYIVTTKTPDYLHVMENVSVAESRKKMLFAFNNRQATTNTPILQEAIRLRAELGKLLGYPTYADYALRQKMAGNSKAVFSFLEGLKKKLPAKNQSDLKTLAQFKARVLKDPSPLVTWDIAYLANQLKIQKYEVDEEVVREYFPAQYVVDQTLDVYSTLLGVIFRRVVGAPVWAPQVDLYEVSDKTTKQVIGYFYADLIPREGKFGHAAAMSLITGRELNSGDKSYQKPIVAMVANFSPAAPGKPVLLTHNEVETFFHEFGHIVHFVLTKAKYASLAGFNVKFDFVEAPSQMLENWVWQKPILKKMSQHYLDPNRKLPDGLIMRLQKLKMFNSGIQYTRQLVLGQFDMNIHTNPSLDVTEEYEKLYQSLVGLKVLEGSHFPATFGHMMGGYSAGYYGYLWSQVFAEDMFSVFQRKGILNPDVGMKYRTIILESGNMRDPMDLIKAFLGREPNSRAFFKTLGI